MYSRYALYHWLWLQLSEELQDSEVMINARVLREASVIGMTITGAAIHAELISKIPSIYVLISAQFFRSFADRVAPKTIIVEEAAEIMESQLLAVLPSSARHLIMIGDHKQLRPQVQCDLLRRRHRLDVSMFERLITGSGEHRLPYAQLGYQCRMREEFVQLIRDIYPELETNKQVHRCLTFLCPIAYDGGQAETSRQADEQIRRHTAVQTGVQTRLLIGTES